MLAEEVGERRWEQSGVLMKARDLSKTGINEPEKLIIMLRRICFDQYPEIQEKAKRFLNGYFKWKVRKWNREKKQNELNNIENEELLCKICAKKVPGGKLKNHSVICKELTELRIDLKEKKEELDKNYLSILQDNRRKFNLQVTILKKKLIKLKKRAKGCNDRRSVLETEKSPRDLYNYSDDESHFKANQATKLRNIRNRLNYCQTPTICENVHRNKEDFEFYPKIQKNDEEKDSSETDRKNKNELDSNSNEKENDSHENDGIEYENKLDNINIINKFQQHYQKNFVGNFYMKEDFIRTEDLATKCVRKNEAIHKRNLSTFTDASRVFNSGMEESVKDNESTKEERISKLNDASLYPFYINSSSLLFENRSP